MDKLSIPTLCSIVLGSQSHSEALQERNRDEITDAIKSYWQYSDNNIDANQQADSSRGNVTNDLASELHLPQDEFPGQTGVPSSHCFANSFIDTSRHSFSKHVDT